MGYKIISRFISKEELKKNKFLQQEFILNSYEERLNLIYGIVTNKENENIEDCAVVLQYRAKNRVEYENLKVVYTNKEGVFGLPIEIDENKEYRLVIFAPNKLD